MGKAKKRNFQSCKRGNESISSLPASCSRKDAVQEVISRVKEADFSAKTKDIITLFGISPEELSEAGASYEDLKALKVDFL